MQAVCSGIQLYSNKHTACISESKTVPLVSLTDHVMVTHTFHLSWHRNWVVHAFNHGGAWCMPLITVVHAFKPSPREDIMGVITSRYTISFLDS